MALPFDELNQRRRAWIARASLAELSTVLGRPGLAATATRPDVTAKVDQHTAAIREALAAGDKPIDPIALAGYAAAIRDAAQQRGDRLDDWSRPTWTQLRLLAVCALAA